MPNGYGIGRTYAYDSPWSRSTPASGGGKGLRPDQRPGTPLPMPGGGVPRMPKRVTPWERMGIGRPSQTQQPQRQQQAGSGGSPGEAVLAQAMEQLIRRMMAPPPSPLGQMLGWQGPAAQPGSSGPDLITLLGQLFGRP